MHRQGNLKGKLVFSHSVKRLQDRIESCPHNSYAIEDNYWLGELLAE